MFFTLGQIKEALKHLESVHPFFGLTYLVFKKNKLPIGTTIEFPAHVGSMVKRTAGTDLAAPGRDGTAQKEVDQCCGFPLTACWMNTPATNSCCIPCTQMGCTVRMDTCSPPIKHPIVADV